VLSLVYPRLNIRPEPFGPGANRHEQNQEDIRN